MDDEMQPGDFGKYVLAVRGRWWAIPLGVILGALFASLGLKSGNPVTGASAELVFRERAGVLLASQLEGVASSPPRRAPAELVAKYKSNEFQRSLAKRHPGAILAVGTTPAFGGVPLSVSSPSAKVSKAVLDDVVSEIRQGRRADARRDFSEAIELLTERKSSLIARYDEISKELSETNASSGLAVALSTERIALWNRLETLKGSERAMRVLVEDPQAGVEVVDLVDPTRATVTSGSLSPGRTLSFGLVCGVMGALAVAGLALIDGRLRTRRDVEAVCGSGSWRGLDAGGKGDDDPLALALSIRHALPFGGEVHVAGVNAEGSLGSATAAFGQRLEGALLRLGQLDADTPPLAIKAFAYGPELLQVANQASLVLFLASTESTRAADLRTAWQEMTAAGVNTFGVVLTDVAPAARRWVV